MIVTTTKTIKKKNNNIVLTKEYDYYALKRMSFLFLLRSELKIILIRNKHV
jgi:hypothetical protein